MLNLRRVCLGLAPVAALVLTLGCAEKSSPGSGPSGTPSSDGTGGSAGGDDAGNETKSPSAETSDGGTSGAPPADGSAVADGDAGEPDAEDSGEDSYLNSPNRLPAELIPMLGKADSAVRLLMFGDFECPATRDFAHLIHTFDELYGDRIAIEFHHFPLSFHEASHPIHEASIEAHRAGRFWEFYDLVMASEYSCGRWCIEDTARKLGLDLDQLKQVLDNGTNVALVDQDVAYGNELWVNATPSFFVNGKLCEMKTGAYDLKACIEEALVEAGLSVEE